MDKTKAISFNKMMKNLRKFCEHLKTQTSIKVEGAGFSIQRFVQNVLTNCMIEKKKGTNTSPEASGLPRCIRDLHPLEKYTR